MVIVTKEISNQIILKVKVVIYHTINNYILVLGIIIVDMDMENKHIPMEVVILVIGLLINDMVLVN